MRNFILALLTAALTGCVAPPTRFDAATAVTFTSLRPSTERFPLLDQRPSGALNYRVVEVNGTYQYLGEEAIQPRPTVLLSSKLAKAVPDEYRASPIELTRLDIGYWTVTAGKPPPQMNAGRPQVSPVVPAAAVVLGNVIGEAAVYALHSVMAARIKEAGVANVEIRVGEYPVSSVQVVPIRDGVSPAQAVERAFTMALENICEKVDAMKYWDRAYMAQ